MVVAAQCIFHDTLRGVIKAIKKIIKKSHQPDNFGEMTVDGSKTPARAAEDLLFYRISCPNASNGKGGDPHPTLRDHRYLPWCLPSIQRRRPPRRNRGRIFIFDRNSYLSGFFLFNCVSDKLGQALPKRAAVVPRRPLFSPPTWPWSARYRGRPAPSRTLVFRLAGRARADPGAETPLFIVGVKFPEIVEDILQLPLSLDHLVVFFQQAVLFRFRRRHEVQFFLQLDTLLLKVPNNLPYLPFQDNDVVFLKGSRCRSLIRL